MGCRKITVVLLGGKTLAERYTMRKIAKLQKIVNDLTGEEINRRSEAYKAGWRIERDNKNGIIYLSNTKTDAEYFGYRDALKNGGWGKTVYWND